jgi:MoxR-like ATPase
MAVAGHSSGSVADPVVAEDTDALMTAVGSLRTQVGKRIVGQTAVVDEVIMALLAGGHALLVGVPGLA